MTMEHQQRLQRREKSATEAARSTSNAASPAGRLAPPYTPQTILQLQRTIGNKAVGDLLKGRQVAASETIQRDIIVQNIDFDPTAPLGQGFSHGYINVKNFAAQLRAALLAAYGPKPSGKAAQNDPYAQIRIEPKLNAVITEVALHAVKDQTPHYAAPDIPSLAQVIADDIKRVYIVNKVTGGWSGTVHGAILKAVRETLINNLNPDYRMMNSEENAFDQLIAQAGNDASRAKGTATPLPRAKLGDLAGAVMQVHAALVAANNAMTKAAFCFEWTNQNLLTQHFAMNYYQGNHTNNAGWLPTPALPVNWLPTLDAAIKLAANANAPLTAALNAPNAQTQINANPALLGAYTPIFNVAAAAYNDNAFRKMAWLALGSGVSTYIEFAIPGHSDDISRLIYDFAGNKFYVTAHYKWNRGYNPFFRITDLQL